MLDTIFYLVGGAITIVLLILSIYCAFVQLYSVFISFWGFGKAKKDYEMIEDKTKFLILVAAHNEEKVIASTVDNLREIDYNPELFDIVVVNDNSTDSTQQVCERIGVRHINTGEKVFPREGVGKPAGLQYALRALGFEKVREDYDMVMIVDADNHVDSHILKDVNSQFIGKGKPQAIQCYLDSKNWENYLSLGYTTAYVTTNRFFQLAKYRMGLPNTLGGTGFAVRTDYLIETGGFNYKSLTEDLEMEMEIVSSGGNILWNHFARVYDEKPEDIKISMKQRTRWMQGHWYVAFTYGGKLLKEFFKKWRWRYIDKIMYLFAAMKTVSLVIMFVSLLFSLVIINITHSSTLAAEASENAWLLLSNVLLFRVSTLTLIMFVYGLIVQVYYAFKMDSRMNFTFKTFIGIYYYAFTFMVCQITGLLKWRHQHTWVKTEHKVVKKSE